MNFKIKKSYKLFLAGLLCTTLTACGGGGGSDPVISNNNNGLNGVVINNSNYESVFRTGVTGSLKLTLQLIFAFDNIDTSRLILLPSSSSNTTAYQCDNPSGTLQVTDLGSNTKEWAFDDCQILDIATGTHYQGIATIETVLNSGLASQVGFEEFDWSQTQYFAFSNFIQTYPVINGPSRRANGNTIIETTNDTAQDLNRTTAMRSTNLQFDEIAVSEAVTNYTFSDFYYNLQEDTADEDLRSTMDFTANITGIGDIDVITNPMLQFDDIGTLLSGTGFVTTGNSVARMVATGGDDIEISLDPENDGVYESPISTTWATIHD
jgi:hypothetical protein